MFISNANFTKDTMKRLICALLFVVISTSAFWMPGTAKAATAGRTNAKVVLRKEASKESKSLQTLPVGEEVDIISASGDWYKVRYGKFTGYVEEVVVIEKFNLQRSVLAIARNFDFSAQSCG